MPASPSPAQSAASRANGALSRGPATPDGKARSAANATRHGLRATSGTVPPEHAPDLAALRDALTARLAPVDPVERHWVGEIAFALWQQQRLQAVTAEAIADAQSGTDEPEPPACPRSPRSPATAPGSSATCGSRRKSLEAARQSRPRLPSDPGLANPARLRWLADRIEAGLADRAPANDTGEPEPASTAGTYCILHERTRPRTRRRMHERTRASPAAEPPRAPQAPGAGPQVLRARGVRVSAAPANASGGHLAMAAAPEPEMSRLATPPRAARDRRTTGRSPAGTSPGR